MQALRIPFSFTCSAARLSVGKSRQPHGKTLQTLAAKGNQMCHARGALSARAHTFCTCGARQGKQRGRKGVNRNKTASRCVIIRHSPLSLKGRHCCRMGIVGERRRVVHRRGLVPKSLSPHATLSSVCTCNCCTVFFLFFFARVVHQCRGPQILVQLDYLTKLEIDELVLLIDSNTAQSGLPDISGHTLNDPSHL